MHLHEQLQLIENLLCLLQVIFQHYARDLEAVQAQYEAQKHNPPVPHNVPPTAGNIMWSRQLLSRIEEPMQLFAKNKSLMAMKESKKVIKLYNRVSAGSPAVLQA
jgi:dynein heavy chain